MFDNLKVVMEGDLYELDLVGSIIVSDRKDIINLATMSRTFIMRVTKDNLTFGTIELQADIKNLAGELQNSLENPGCLVELMFTKPMERNDTIEESVMMWKKELQNIWPQRQITMKSLHTYDSNEPEMVTALIHFRRSINEENIDDLREMIKIMVSCL
ncbi:hypothetical protein [Bacillus sp. THAF10]|uniref:hypothetical protein n=1 Tax=Bacillus sp. THAF10 TaxID=2587848 RepID=UPI001269087B|nr:hypothetical protein [Bacillus sp. THAF10]